MEALSYHTHEDAYFAKLLAPTTDLNGLLATAAAQTEVLEMLTAPLYHASVNHTASMSTDALAANLVSRGLKHIRSWFINPFNGWVLITCLVVNAWLIIKALQCCGCKQKSQKLVLAVGNTARRRWPRLSTPGPAQDIKLRNLETALDEVTQEPPETQPLDPQASQSYEDQAGRL